jgi:hypothetical protein
MCSRGYSDNTRSTFRILLFPLDVFDAANTGMRSENGVEFNDEGGSYLNKVTIPFDEEVVCCSKEGGCL